MHDLLAAAVHDAEVPASAVRRGEVVEVRASRTRRRKHRITADGSTSSQAVTVVEPMMVRLAGAGLEVHVRTDDMSGAKAGDVLREARGMMAYGRPFVAAAHLHQPTVWPVDAYVDRTLECPAQPLSAFWHAVQRSAGIVGGQLGLSLRVTEALVSEELYAEAFTRSEGDSRSFAATRIELQLSVEVRQDKRQTRLRAGRQGGFLADLPLTDILTEAAYRGAVTLAGSSTPAARPYRRKALLLAPRPTAALIRVLANDLFDRPDVDCPETGLTHVVVDDPHARGGGYVRPYDHEGTPTARTVLLDETGRRARMVGRADSGNGRGGLDLLTGHSYVLTGRGAPSAYPTNVSIHPSTPGTGRLASPNSFSGQLGFNLRGDGTQRFRAGETIRFRVETVAVERGAVAGPGTILHVSGTARQLVAAIQAVTPTASYLSWRDHSTECAWALLPDIGALSSE
jgi:predicted Zn-dependent protease